MSAKLQLTPGQPRKAKVSKQAKRRQEQTNSLEAQPASPNMATVPTIERIERRGRPAAPFDQEIADAYCEWIASGKSANQFYKLSGMPCRQVLDRWEEENEVFAAKYMRARARSAWGYADEIINISDTEEDPRRAHVRIEARKWIACKLLPRIFGDRQQVDHKVGFTSEFETFIREINERRLAKSRPLNVLTIEAKADET